MAEQTTNDAIVTVPIGRPERANALRQQDKADLAGRIRAAAERAGAVILTGAPSQTFCAGTDIDEMASFGAAEMRSMLEAEVAVYRTILEVETPVIAAVNGPALGAGFIIAMCCDQLVMAENATVGLPELTIGVSIPLHGFLLPFIVGLGRARTLYYRGHRTGAAEAASLGIANDVVPLDRLVDTAEERGRELAKIQGGAFAVQKRLLNRHLLQRIVGDVVDASLAEASIPFESGEPGSRMRQARHAH